MKKLLISIAIAATLATPASADLLCVRKKVKSAKKVSLSKAMQMTTDATCPRGFDPVLDTDASKGLKLSQCRTINVLDQTISGAVDVAEVTLDCELNEFMLNHYGTTSDTTTGIIATIPRSQSPEGYAGGVTYYFARLEPQNTTNVVASVAVTCCPE